MPRTEMSGTGDASTTSASAERGRIGLCLSGGGFRATLFHLGVVRYLRDAGLLTNVAHICAVSGGSIAATHVVRKWASYSSDSDKAFDAVASELIGFVKRDVRGRIVRRLPLSMFGRKWRRSTLVRQMYEELYSTPVEDVPRRPELHVLATNHNFGCLCSFEPDGIVLYKRDGTITLPTQKLEDSVKVTASAAFPAFFPPIGLTWDDLGVEKDKYLPDIQYYTDGGVYDNIGIRRLQHVVEATDTDPRLRLHLLLASDAGRPFDLDLTRRTPGLLKTAWRSNDIALARIGELDLRELSDVLNSPDGSGISDLPSRFQVMSISDEVPVTGSGNALPINIQRLVKAIRTDLDAFSDKEIVFLVQHGYSVARHSIERLQEQCRPYTDRTPQPAIVGVMEKAKAVARGRWLPPDTEPGWPRDKDALIWERDLDKKKLGQSIAELKHSGEIQLRWFSIRDRVSVALSVCVLAAIVGFGYFGWRVATMPSPPIPRIVYSKLGGDLDSGHFAVDPAMPGIKVSERTIEIDLRNEVFLKEEERDLLRLAPSVQTYTIKGVRESTAARYLVYEFSSQRKLMDIAAITEHPFQVRYRQDPSAGGDGFDNVYTMIVDLNGHSPDIPFSVGFRVTRWNAYQAVNGNFVGALVSGDEGRVVLRVLLPQGKRYRSATLQERRQETGVRWGNSVDREPPVPSQDRTSFVWTLEHPQKGWGYRAMIDWE